MVAFNSSIKLFLFASLSVAIDANDAGTSLLRGNGHKEEPGAPGRELVEMDMTMGLGQMVCKERIPVDGSVICQFRVMPPPDLTTSTIQHDCLYSSVTGKNFCLSTTVDRIRVDEVADTTTTDPTVNDPPSNIVTPGVLPVGQVGTCPSAVQNSGLACNQYVPAGDSSIVCIYGRLRCECSVENPSLASPWDCFVPPEDPVVLPSVPAPIPAPEPVTVPAPVPVTIPAPVPIPQNINADINQVVISPTLPPIDIQYGQFTLVINNDESCPSQPSEGAACDWNTRCTYAVELEGGGLKGLNCDCNGDCVYQCRDATQPPFSF